MKHVKTNDFAALGAALKEKGVEIAYVDESGQEHQQPTGAVFIDHGSRRAGKTFTRGNRRFSDQELDKMKGYTPAQMVKAKQERTRVDRRNEPHEESVKRYLDHPKDETFEERKTRINNFRAGG